MTRRLFVLVFAAMAAGGASLQAQARPQPQDPKATVPATHLPPPGMCRIWLDKVPPKQQPAPTDCATAVRNRPSNGRVIFGDDYVEKTDKGDKKEIPFLKKFGDDRKKP